MRIIKIIFLPIIIISYIAISCKKEPTAPILQTDTTNITKGLFVLNEGLFNRNNSTLTYFSFTDSVAQTDYFNLQNGRKLGDTGNDMKIYGSKMYIVMNGSSQVEVINPFTGKSIKQIPIFNGAKPRQPRYIAFYGTNAFICSFDGTVAVIDTATLEIEKYIAVGHNPDGIAVANQKVYVSNSGGLNVPNYDSTISVINAVTLVETKKIPVRINPYIMVPDKYGDIFVISRGNYNNIKSCLQVIDSKTDELKYTFSGFEATNLAIKGDTVYVYYYDYTSANSKIMLINVKNETLINDNFVSDGTVIETPYGIAIDNLSGDVFISDAKGFVNTGEVVCFNKDGKKKYSFKAGLNPGHVAFLSETNIKN